MKRVHVAVLAACVLCLSAAGPVCAQPRRTDRELEDEGLARTKQADDLKGPVRALRVEKASVYRVGGKYAERRRRVVETGAYDSSGRKTEITYHGEGGELTARTAYAYADEGRRVTSTYFDAAGQLTGTSTETFDRHGNKLESVYRGADGALRQRWSFAYDARGNRTSWEFQVPGASTSGRYVLTYDAAGRKVKEEEFTDGRLETVRTFDRKEREVEAVFFLPDGSVHRRDLRRYRGNAVEWLTYEPDGKLSGRARYLYDAKGRLLRHVSYGDDGKPSSVETYAYDAHGNESQASYADGALESRTAVRASEGGRKRSEVVYGPGGSVLHETTYVRKLDAHGNWVRETAYKHFVQGGRKFFGPVEVTERFISYY